MDKRKLRKEMLDKRADLSPELIVEKSTAIQDKLFALDLYKKASFIFSFISFKDEVNTHNIIKDSISLGKRVGVPITIHKERKLLVSELLDFDRELERGYYSILNPKKEFIREVCPGLIDIVLVPGLIFSLDGYRVGYGGGYYDRFFSENEQVLKIGLCFDMQIADSVPKDAYDIPVDFIITEDRLVKCS